MADEYTIIDIWIGQFPSRDFFESYFEETISGEPEDDDKPISPFGADQKAAFYDHDFMETNYHDAPRDFTSLLEGHSFAKSYEAPATEAWKAIGSPLANALVLVWGKEIESPRSVEKSSYFLRYLGRFPCQP